MIGMVLVALAVTAVTASSAAAGTATTTDLVLVKAIVTDVTTGSTTVASPGDAIKFVVVARNRGPDTAADLQVYLAAINIVDYGWYCFDSPYSSWAFTSSQTGCGFANVPAGTKIRAMRLKGLAETGNSVQATFCVRVDPTYSPDQTDPKSANDCKTASIPLA